MPANPNLKSVYDDSNKVTDVGLSVTYRQHFNGEYWEITRIAKKQYQFIGMDEDTAYECAAAKRSQYTRAFARIDTSSGSPERVYAVGCPSDIAPQHGDGDVWSVSIAVNEEDIVHSDDSVSDPATLFAEANARNYDEDVDIAAITISSATRTGETLVIQFSTGLGKFDPSRVVCQYKTSESETTWTSVYCTCRNGVATVTPAPPSGALFVRLVYGNIESNTFIVE